MHKHTLSEHKGMRNEMKRETKNRERGEISKQRGCGSPKREEGGGLFLGKFAVVIPVQFHTK